jgi:hypothetical protein
VGWNVTAGAVVVAEFFAEVRAINRALPAEERIRVWLGDPPHRDGDGVITADEYQVPLERRGTSTSDAFPLCRAPNCEGLDLAVPCQMNQGPLSLSERARIVVNATFGVDSARMVTTGNWPGA